MCMLLFGWKVPPSITDDQLYMFTYLHPTHIWMVPLLTRLKQIDWLNLHRQQWGLLLLYGINHDHFSGCFYFLSL